MDNLQKYIEKDKSSRPSRWDDSNINRDKFGCVLIDETYLFNVNEDISIHIHLNEEQGAFSHKHNFFEMTYVHEGNFVQNIDNDKFVQQSDEVVLLSLEAKHSPYLPDKSSTVFNILISRAAVENSLLQILSRRNPLLNFFLDSLFGIYREKNYLLFKTTDNLSVIIQTMIREYFEQEVLYEQNLMGLLMQLLTEFARINSRQDTDISIKNILVSSDQIEQASHTSLSSEIICYMKQHYSTVTIKDISNHFGYSERHIRRIIQNYANTSFSDLLNEYKINGACIYLEKTQLPVSKIIEVVGFSDPNYFYKVFKKKKGISFSSYRESSTK